MKKCYKKWIGTAAIFISDNAKDDGDISHIESHTGMNGNEFIFTLINTENGNAITIQITNYEEVLKTKIY